MADCLLMKQWNHSTFGHYWARIKLVGCPYFRGRKVHTQWHGTWGGAYLIEWLDSSLSWVPWRGVPRSVAVAVSCLTTFLCDNYIPFHYTEQTHDSKPQCFIETTVAHSQVSSLLAHMYIMSVMWTCVSIPDDYMRLLLIKCECHHSHQNDNQMPSLLWSPRHVWYQRTVKCIVTAMHITFSLLFMSVVDLQWVVINPGLSKIIIFSLRTITMSTHSTHDSPVFIF